MNIITVIPLTRSKVASTLSYFTASEVPVGAIVSVPLRSKAIHAVVTETRPAQDLKTEIKTAPFEIRKLGAVKAAQFFPAAFIESCRALAEHYATNVGAVIDTLVADALLEQGAKLPPPLPPQTDLWNNAPRSASRPAEETYAIQGDDADRVSTWRSLIRQEFARKRSVAFYVPSIEDAKQLFAGLERGIEGYIFTLHAGLTPKKIGEVWKAVADTAHPIVVIATGSFALVPRGDIETIVIERENARGWIGQKAPYLDLRHALETHARRQHQTVYLADSLLRAETLRRLDAGDIAEGSPFKWRSISHAKDQLVDMRSYKAAENGFRVISPELEALIARNRDESTHLFIMTMRRGMSPSTVCQDCETIVACKNCSAPVVLHTSKASGRNFFMCHKCGERRSADETCVDCGSWRLAPLGIGIERVAQEIRERFPDIDLFQIDADATKTDKQIADALAGFRAKPGSVLIGTEMALTHLGSGGTATDPAAQAAQIEHVAVVSLDSLFALPDFRIHEKIMYTLVRLRALATRTVLVQTRKPDERVFEFGLKGNLSDWNRLTQEERAQFRYPPYAVLIKITLEGKKDAIAEGMAEIQKALEPYEMDIFPAFTATVRGNSVIHGLIKLEPHGWPHSELAAKLRALPPGASVKINPDSLL